jgi:dihydropteroate synthase
MGVLNVTPDSFSDGGQFAEADSARAHALAMVNQGADLLDVGGESTRPGAQRPSAEQESNRAVPVVAGLASAGVPVSIDTMRAQVAVQAVAAGAGLVNDVSGGLADPAMLPAVAELGVPVVLMHWRGPSATMASQIDYDDVVTDVRDHLAARVDAAMAAGIDEAAIVLDPGLGFAKTPAHNWSLLNRLDTLVDLGFPVLVAASRKSFLGALLADEDGPRPVEQREAATTAATALAAAAGAWAVRVHEVAASADAVRVAARWAVG